MNDQPTTTGDGSGRLGAAPCSAAYPKCWACNKDVEGKNKTTMLDGSILCDRCKEAKRRAQLGLLNKKRLGTLTPKSGSALWECTICNVTGTWDEWTSSAEPGEHKCDVCLEFGRRGIIRQMKAPNDPSSPTGAKPVGERKEDKE